MKVKCCRCGYEGEKDLSDYTGADALKAVIPMVCGWCDGAILLVWTEHNGVHTEPRDATNRMEHIAPRVLE